MSKMYRLVLIILFLTPLALLECVPFTFAQQPPDSHESENFIVPVYTITRGGVSMGSYMAGINWVLLEMLSATSSTHEDNDSLVEIAWRYRTTRRPLHEHRLVGSSGASAGNINSVLTAISACQPDRRGEPPEASLYWKIWVNTGIEQLLPMMNRRQRRAEIDSLQQGSLGLGEGQVGGLLHLDFYTGRAGRSNHLSTIKEEVSKYELRDDCDYPIGIPLTHKENRTDSLAGLPIPTKRSVALFTFGANGFSNIDNRFLGDGIANYGHVIFPPPDSQGKLTARQIISFSSAGSAFPLAFSPIELSYLETDHRESNRQNCVKTPLRPYIPEWRLEDGSVSHSPSTQGGDPCLKEKAGQFLDGGIFDNRPIGIAYQFWKSDKRYWENRRFQLMIFQMIYGSVVGDGAWSPDLLDFETSKRYSSSPTFNYNDPEFIFVAPKVLRDRQKRVKQRTSPSNQNLPSLAPGLRALMTLGRTFVPAARYYELNALLRALELDMDGGELESRLRVTRRGFPIMGERAMSFAAFLGRPFREIDFLTGVYDGIYWFAENVLVDKESLSDPARADLIADLLRFLDDRSHSRPGRAPSERMVDNRLTYLSAGVLNELFRIENGAHVENPIELNESRATHRSDSTRLDMARTILGHMVRQREGFPDECSTDSTGSIILNYFCRQGVIGVLKAINEWDRHQQELRRAGLDSLVDLREVDGQTFPTKSRGANLPYSVASGTLPIDCSYTFPYSEPCVIDDTFKNLVRDPSKMIGRLTERMFAQLWSVEALRNQFGLPAVESGVELAHAAYRSRIDLPGRDSVTMSTSIPARVGGRPHGLWRLLPYHITWGSEMFRRHGRDLTYYYALGYRLSFANDRKPFAISTDLIFPGTFGERRLMASAGYQWFRPGVFWSGFMLDLASVYVHPGKHILPAHWTQYSPSASVLLFGGKARVDVRYIFGDERTHRFQLGFGMTDFAGLIYWAVRQI